jgi:3'-phosphoadenosine 5'-phosphosulfate sulfotransferase (PAPS reductase)/FAD synthetase
VNVVCWSGGKDSTATLVLAHEQGIKIDLVLMSLLWFDKRRGIYAINPVMLDWIINYAKPLIESWGFPVKILSSEKDYIYYFYKKRQSYRKPENIVNIGKHNGFLLGGMCVLQQEKVKPIEQYLRNLSKDCSFTEIIGICADERKRIEGMKKRGYRSLLVENNIKQKETISICEPYGMVAPTYKMRKRDGCWFCPNQSIAELAELKLNYPHYYAELAELAKVENTVARGFRYGVSFADTDKEVDKYISRPIQLSIFD